MGKKSSVAIINIGGLRELLAQLKRNRTHVETLQGYISADQREALASLRAVDPENNGVVVTVDGETLCAYYQQNEPGETWDMERLVPYLRKTGMLRSVQTTFIDPQKIEAEIKVGNLAQDELARFRIKHTPPKPFVRFGKVTRNSIPE